MAEGPAVANWWSPAKRAAWIPMGGRLYSLDRELLPALDALANQLTPAAPTPDPAGDTEPARVDAHSRAIPIPVQPCRLIELLVGLR